MCEGEGVCVRGRGVGEGEGRRDGGPRNSWSRTGDGLCISHSNQHYWCSAHGRRPRAAQHRGPPRLRRWRTCWLTQTRNYSAYEGVAGCRPCKHDYTQSSAYTQILGRRSSHSHPCHNPGAPWGGGGGHCGPACRHCGYRSDRLGNLLTSDPVSRRHSSRFDLPFPGPCEADWWTAVRSSACLVRREKTRMRPLGSDTESLLPTRKSKKGFSQLQRHNRAGTREHPLNAFYHGLSPPITMRNVHSLLAVVTRHESFLRGQGGIRIEIRT